MSKMVEKNTSGTQDGQDEAAGVADMTPNNDARDAEFENGVTTG